LQHSQRHWKNSGVGKYRFVTRPRGLGTKALNEDVADLKALLVFFLMTMGPELGITCRSMMINGVCWDDCENSCGMLWVIPPFPTKHQ